MVRGPEWSMLIGTENSVEQQAGQIREAFQVYAGTVTEYEGTLFLSHIWFQSVLLADRIAIWSVIVLCVTFRNN